MSEKQEIVLAVDPGSEYSAYVLLARGTRKVLAFAKVDNDELLGLIQDGMLSKCKCSQLAIEHPQPRGQLASSQLFETLRWIGRYEQVARQQHMDINFVDRKDVKMVICEHPRAKDPQIRQAVIDLYGGEKLAIGGKKCQRCKGKGWTGRNHDPCEKCPDTPGWESVPGPLHGMARDCWQALGVGITFDEMNTPFNPETGRGRKGRR